MHAGIDHEPCILAAEQQRIDEEIEIEDFACDDGNMISST